jgi:PEP-CTERM motif
MDGLFGSLAVPEPSTWAMLLLGFTRLGIAGYWASRRTAAAA